MMTDYSIRVWQETDKPLLNTLAADYFGQAADDFQRLFLKEGSCILAEKDGCTPGAAYLIPGCGMFPYRKNTLSVGCVYTQASDIGMREALSAAAAEKLFATEDAVCFLPGGETNPVPEGGVVLGNMKELHLKKSAFENIRHGMTGRIDAATYYGLREGFLNGLPHAVYSEEYYDLLDTMIEGSGGGYFMTQTGIAAVVADGPVCRVLELLEPDSDGMTSLAGIAAYCPAEEYIVRTPLFFDVPGERKSFVTGLLKTAPDYPIPFDLWWGFGLD